MDCICDIEAVFSLDTEDGGIIEHSKLLGCDKENQHPISAITGLQEVLEGLENDESQLGDQVQIIQADINILKTKSNNFATKEDLENINPNVDLSDYISKTEMETQKLSSALEVKNQIDILGDSGHSIQINITEDGAQITSDNILSLYGNIHVNNPIITSDVTSFANASSDSFMRKAQISQALANKVDKNQGIENKGKCLIVGSDGNITTTSLPTNPVTVPNEKYGIQADYALKYGILDCPNGLINYSINHKEIEIQAGVVFRAAGSDTKTMIASNTKYNIGNTGEVVLFFVRTESQAGTIQISFLEAKDVYYQETEPDDGVGSYLAWFQPSKGVWQFKSTDTGNVWRTAIATPLANIKAGEIGITSINYIGYRLFDDDNFAQLSDIENLQHTIQDLLTRIEALENK